MKISMCNDRYATVFFRPSSLPDLQSGKLGERAHTMLVGATSPNPFAHKYSFVSCAPSALFRLIIETGSYELFVFIIPAVL